MTTNTLLIYYFKKMKLCTNTICKILLTVFYFVKEIRGLVALYK